MNNLLLEYMEARVTEKSGIKQLHGPVITISREAGCSAGLIAGKLQHCINNKLSAAKNSHLWRTINREVVEKAARELHLDPTKISYVFRAEAKTLIDDVLEALSTKYYKSDISIRKTIVDVIRSMSDEGYSIMVGRGAVAFTKGKKESLNVMLQAPIDWRIEVIRKKHLVSEREAENFIKQTDKERALLLEHFYKKKTDHTIYDVIFNCESFSVDQIVESIFYLADMKGILSVIE